tara:strand:+ start:274 stop:609 length:336 start_codon:yes stop_codon:yes gene_type:complete
MKSTLRTVQDLERWRDRQYFRDTLHGDAKRISRYKVTGEAFKEIIRQAQELRGMLNNPALQMGMIYQHYFIEDGIPDEEYSFYSNWKEQVAQQKRFKELRNKDYEEYLMRD